MCIRDRCIIVYVSRNHIKNGECRDQIDVTGVREPEIQAMTESTVMSGLGIHSTPTVVQNRELNESAVIDDSGIQLTPISTNKSNQPDSNDIMSILRAISRDINEVKNNFDKQNNKVDALSLSLIHI